MVAYSMTLTESYNIRISILAAPVGAWYGCIIVNGRCSEMTQINDLLYQVRLWGANIGRCTAATVYVIFGDTTGITVNTADTLTITGDPIPFIPEPATWVIQLLQANWDTVNIMPRPEIVEPMTLKWLVDPQISPVHITVTERGVKTKKRGRGDYKDVQYPIEIDVRSQGDAVSERLCKKAMAEVKRIIELNWNFITAEPFDWIDYEDDAVNLSVEAAGAYHWRWKIKLMAEVRGRAGTPADPIGP